MTSAAPEPEPEPVGSLGRAPAPAPPAHRSTRRRLAAAALLAATIAAGLVVHLALPDSAATDIAGDALYAVAVYLAVVIAWVRQHPFVVGAIAAAWCVGIELFQLTGIPLAAGAAFAPAMLVLGTVFDARDLVVYVAVILVVSLFDRLSARRRPA
ncbi:DUF2809 domain-containing protein [Microbacterium fluvii]|uniref:DUF2809 domain-containing protein n=1 Tax=Microbacterium fluvii TaxID=415215 RepID=A0ABW2HFQ2_9MICO|nr:DUF2809 domain-containing protein [Microbacterium fluvii]MCU4673595.1 DUF2809 domain-containing protein [Microbacterium fluvii]